MAGKIIFVKAENIGIIYDHRPVEHSIDLKAFALPLS